MTKLRKSALTTIADKAVKNLDKTKQVGKFSSSYIPRTSQSDGRTFTIYCILNYDSRRKTFSTGIKGDYREIRKGTTYLPTDPTKVALLNDLTSKLFASFTDLRITCREIDLRLIWLMANGETLDDPTPNLLRCMDLFMEEVKEKHKAGMLGYKAYQKIKGFDKRIREFVINKLGKYATIDDLKPAHSTSLRLWLTNDCKLSANYSDYIVSHLKRVLEFAVENEWVTRNAFLRFRKRKIRNFIKSLTEAQVDKLRTMDIFAPALEPVRNAFLFQCYTGLSYKDMSTVTTDDILTDEKTGIEFIMKRRSKTGNPSIIPIITEARRIIDLYANHPQRLQRRLLIPTMSNQRYNNYLKQIGGLLGIEMILTSHVGRKTAATIFLTKGVALESVSAILGHSSTKMTQDHYATVNPDRVIRDLGNVTQLSKAQ